MLTYEKRGQQNRMIFMIGIASVGRHPFRQIKQPRFVKGTYSKD